MQTSAILLTWSKDTVRSIVVHLGTARHKLCSSPVITHRCILFKVYKSPFAIARSGVSLWSKLVQVVEGFDRLFQPVLSKKYASILFLHSLASAPQQSTITSAFLPSLAPPPPRPASTAPSPVDHPPQFRQPSGKSKADILREYRQRSGKLYDTLELQAAFS